MSAGLVFLISILFDLYLWAIILRIMLQVVRADYYNPLSQLVIKLTDVPLKFFYKLLPYKKGIDYAGVAFGFLVVIVKVALLLVLLGLPIGPIHLLFFSILDFVQQLLSLYFYIIIVVAIASWFVRGMGHPVLTVLAKVSDPVIQPIRKVVPTIAGLDFSPLIALILIKVVQIVIMQLTLGL